MVKLPTMPFSVLILIPRTKNQVLSRAFSFIFIIREVSAVGWRIIGLSSDELVSNSPGLYPSHDGTFW